MAAWLVLGVGASQSAIADGTQVYKTLGQAVPSIVYSSLNLGHKATTDVVHVCVNLAPTNYGALSSYAATVCRPGSPNYHKFLTPEQVGDRFGMPQAKFDEIANYLKSKGFTIKLKAKNRTTIMADAPSGVVESTFQTSISNFQSIDPKEKENRIFYSYTKPVRVPSQYYGLIRSVSGLQTHTKPHPMADALTPGQTRSLYNSLPLFTEGYTGAGRNVAISNWDGFLLSNVPIFIKAFGLPTPSAGAGSNIKVVTISGGAGSGTAEGEGDLDIQMVIGQAPLCNLTIYDSAATLASTLAVEADANTADIISESWGWILSADDALACHTTHLAMTAQGITYLYASGDYGTSIEPYSYGDYEPEVLLVGGTIATVDSTGARASEVGWSGSGGGWLERTDSFNTLPSWQKGTGVPSGINKRLVPDVALNASGNGTGAYQFVLAGSLTSAYSGTSFACPVFAGNLAIVEQKLIALNSLASATNGRARFGRINDVFYGQQQRADVWYDVTSGPSIGTLPDGTDASPTTGWDFVTGLGAINFDNFVTAYATPPVTAVPSSVTIYTGSKVSGSYLSMAAVDGNSFVVSTYEYSGYGQMGGDRVYYTLSQDPAKVQTMAFSMTSTSHTQATIQVFALNVATNTYQLMISTPGSTTSGVAQFSFTTPANFISSTGTVSLVVRAIAPDRLGTGSFNFSVDQAKLIIQARS